jgi:hypothetical protein
MNLSINQSLLNASNIQPALNAKKRKLNNLPLISDESDKKMKKTKESAPYKKSLNALGKPCFFVWQFGHVSASFATGL